MQKIGRAKQRYARAAPHYKVHVVADGSAQQVTAVTWEKHPKQGSAAMFPGVYCLRTTRVDLDDATLWRTCTMLTQLESVFRSLKTDLGLRPVYHQVQRRGEGASVHQRAGLPFRAFLAPATHGPGHRR